MIFRLNGKFLLFASLYLVEIKIGIAVQKKVQHLWLDSYSPKKLINLRRHC